MEHEKDVENTLPPINTIKLEQISFKYPGRQTYAVKNITTQFIKGEKVAILGVNGAGKTTLISLLLGLYKPTEGAILYGGKNISDINKEWL